MWEESSRYFALSQLRHFADTTKIEVRILLDMTSSNQYGPLWQAQQRFDDLVKELEKLSDTLVSEL